MIYLLGGKSLGGLLSSVAWQAVTSLSYFACISVSVCASSCFFFKSMQIISQTRRRTLRAAALRRHLLFLGFCSKSLHLRGHLTEQAGKSCWWTLHFIRGSNDRNPFKHKGWGLVSYLLLWVPRFSNAPMCKSVSGQAAFLLVHLAGDMKLLAWPHLAFILNIYILCIELNISEAAENILDHTDK